MLYNVQKTNDEALIMKSKNIIIIIISIFSFFTVAFADNIIKSEPAPSRKQWAPVTDAYGRDFSTSTITKVVMLGTGTPLGNPGYAGISVAIIVNGKSYIFDAGPGVFRSIQAATPLMGGQFKALEPAHITTLFLTHLHFDHIEGLPEFILGPWALYRKVPPTIYGPPGTKHLVKNILKAYQKTIDLEMFGMQPITKTGWRAKGVEIMPGVVYHDKNITVTAFENHHGSWDYSYGYRVQTPDRVIIIGGDTAPFDGMTKDYQGADILIHEAYSYDPDKNDYDKKVKTITKPYMSAFHTSTKELATILKKVKPKVTIIYHYVQFEPVKTRSNHKAEDEIKAAGYEGKVIQARDMDVY